MSELTGVLSENVIIYYQGEEATIDNISVNANGELVIQLVTGSSKNLGRVSGYSMSSIKKLSGTSMAGSVDKYGVYLNDSASTKVGEFAVVNGKDGVGSHFYRETISGDNIATDFSITHNLATFDVIVTVYDAITKSDVVVDVTRTDENTVLLSFEVAPTTSEQYSIFIMTMK